jgi:hypothetical protein
MILKSDILSPRIFRCVQYVIKKIHSWITNTYELEQHSGNILHSASGMDTNMDKPMGATGVKRGLP